MRHSEFIAKLAQAGYRLQWSVDVTYADGSAGAGRITQYAKSDGSCSAVIVQDCGEFGFTVFGQSTSDEIAAKL